MPSGVAPRTEVSLPTPPGTPLEVQLSPPGLRAYAVTPKTRLIKLDRGMSLKAEAQLERVYLGVGRMVNTCNLQFQQAERRSRSSRSPSATQV